MDTVKIYARAKKNYYGFAPILVIKSAREGSPSFHEQPYGQLATTKEDAIMLAIKWAQDTYFHSYDSVEIVANGKKIINSKEV